MADRRDLFQHQIIEAATELGTLKERQRTLASRIQHLESMIQQYRGYLARLNGERGETPSKASQRPAKLPLQSSPSSLPDRITQLLDANPDRLFTARKIANLIGAPKSMTTVRTTLYRLARSNRIKRAGRGLYGVAVAAAPSNEKTAVE